MQFVEYMLSFHFTRFLHRLCFSLVCRSFTDFAFVGSAHFIQKLRMRSVEVKLQRFAVSFWSPLHLFHTCKALKFANRQPKTKETKSGNGDNVWQPLFLSVDFCGQSFFAWVFFSNPNSAKLVEVTKRGSRRKYHLGRKHYYQLENPKTQNYLSINSFLKN